MSIDAERLVAAIDDYKAADGVHANRLSYVLERDDARRVAEAAKGEKSTFDPVAFGKQIAAAIEACGWSYRAAADTLGVDHASLHRICQGHRPDVENYVRLRHWIDNADFLARRAGTSGPEPDITIHISECGLNALLYGDGASWTGIPGQPAIYLKLHGKTPASIAPPLVGAQFFAKD